MSIDMPVNDRTAPMVRAFIERLQEIIAEQRLEIERLKQELARARR